MDYSFSKGVSSSSKNSLSVSKEKLDYFFSWVVGNRPHYSKLCTKFFKIAEATVASDSAAARKRRTLSRGDG